MPEIMFELDADHDYVELNQLLKLVGICHSGGTGKLMVADGMVAVDGHTELRKTCKVRAGQRVNVDNVQVQVIAGTPDA